MHTVTRLNNSWRVQFVSTGQPTTIITFSTPIDAYSFCSYLNGGNPLSLSATGHAEYAKQHEPFTQEDLDAE